MLESTARFETENGSKYLQQLCKHFAHKVTVDYTETDARCELPPGPATLQADAHCLSFAVTAADEDGLKLAKYIIEDHIVRFAFREELKSLNWCDQ